MFVWWDLGCGCAILPSGVTIGWSLSLNVVGWFVFATPLSLLFVFFFLNAPPPPDFSPLPLPAALPIYVFPPVMPQQPYLLPPFPRTVRFPVMQIPRQSDIGRLAGHSSGAARNGDVGPRHIHAWTDEIGRASCRERV